MEERHGGGQLFILLQSGSTDERWSVQAAFFHFCSIQVPTQLDGAFHIQGKHKTVSKAKSLLKQKYTVKGEKA
jgi:hypothetical protein